jgi:type IV fimbrial biogenesis protein FimT
MRQKSGSPTRLTTSYVQAMCTQSGLTLLEFIIGVTLTGVILGLGAPALHHVVLDARMTAQVNRFVAGIHMAKQTAITNTDPVVICKSPDGTRCSHDERWDSGWLIFANRDRDHPPQVDPDETRLLATPAFTQGRIVSNRRMFIFRPFQIRSTNGSLYFCDERGAAHARRLIVSYTGRPRMAMPHENSSVPAICER